RQVRSFGPVVRQCIRQAGTGNDRTETGVQCFRQQGQFSALHRAG
ncbi:Tyr recombinase domain-containing protein, partial [Dysosmobacter welbionis]